MRSGEDDTDRQNAERRRHGGRLQTCPGNLDHGELPGSATHNERRDSALSSPFVLHDCSDAGVGLVTLC